MSISTSKELFINMNPKDIPKWDSSKPYYDQTEDALQFFAEERKKFTYGVNIGGFHVHPWLYYHINFFKTPIPTVDSFGIEREIIKNPPLDDLMYYITESYKEAKEKGKILFLFGTRGATKSSAIASLEGWTVATRPNGNFSIIGGSDPDLKAIASLMQKNHSKIHPAFYLPTMKADWESHVEFGVKEKNLDKIMHAEVFITNADPKSKKSTEKGAGLSPVGFVVDEAGKFDFWKPLESAIPSFKTEHGWKLVPVLSGTGGNNELSRDAKRVLSKPDTFDVLPANYDLLNSIVPEKYITWGKKKFGTFIPGQMTYREVIPRIEKPLSEFLNKKNKDLDKVKIRTTNWKLATEVLENLIDKNDDPEKKAKNKMYYPRTTEDCFLTEGKSPFPTAGISAHISYLEDNGIKGSPVEFFKQDGKIKTSFSNKNRAEMDYDGSIVDAPAIVFGTPPETPPAKFTFVAGLDDYKIDIASDSMSHGSMYILKRRALGINEPAEKIAGYITKRPERHIDFHREIEEMLDIWNAMLLMESLDASFKKFLDGKHRTAEILYPTLNYSNTAQSGKKNKVTTTYGMYPTIQNNEHRLGLAVDYCKERYEVGIDDDGNKIIKYGYEFIEDIDLLKEMRDYKKGKNHDRLDAFSYALVLARELDNKKVRPRLNETPLFNFEGADNRKKPQKKINAFSNTGRLKKY